MQPKKNQLDDNPRICPRCGLATARPMRQDSYISLFFIPLIRIKQGEEYLECSRCGPVVQSGSQTETLSGRPAPERCPSCGRGMQPDHSFCPYCGQRV